MDRNIYLDIKTLEEAKELLFGRLAPDLSVEVIQTQDSLGRVTAEAVYSAVSSPSYNASAMDGIAVRAKDTFEASDKNPVVLARGRDFKYVNTGEPISQPFDCVIKIEDVVEAGDDALRINQSAAPGQHVRPVGEDIVANELVIPTRTVMDPVLIGAALAGGRPEIRVYRQPVVGIVPTGSELVEPGEAAGKGRIIEYNSRIFSGYVQAWGGVPKRYPIVPDDFEKIKEQVQAAAGECDIVLIGAGSSAGSRDYTRAVIGQIGEVLAHGLKMQPGKPAVLGIAGDRPLIGVPGYPVSACMVMEQIVKPLLYRMTGREPEKEEILQATLAKKLVSSIKFDEYVRVRLGYVEDKLVASPLVRGAGVIMSLVHADGILRVPVNCEGYEAGQTVDIALRRSREEIRNTIVAIGSHDPLLDVLADLLRKTGAGVNFSSTHVGSMGGILAIRRGEAHMGGVHLLDPEDGTYNVSYIKKYLPGRKIALLHVVTRTQGFMVQKGNPLQISGFAGLAGKGVRFVNRQKGSGTRLLLDYFLRKENIDPADIRGYDTEAFTHLATAAAIAEDEADVALGIYSAAHSQGLDFVPVCEEQYDLAIPQEFLKLPQVKKVLEVVCSGDFLQAAQELGGYGTAEAGRITMVE